MREEQVDNWRAASTFTPTSALSDNEKAFLKAAKQLRGIWKLESAGSLDSKQQEKIAGKQTVMDELCALCPKLPGATDLLEKNPDVAAAIPAKMHPKKPAASPPSPAGKGGKAPPPTGKGGYAAAPARPAPPKVPEPRHERPVCCVAVSADGERVFSCSKDKLVLQWISTNLSKAERQYFGHNGAVYGVDADRDGDGILCSVSADGQALFFKEQRDAGVSEPVNEAAVGGIAKGVKWSPAGSSRRVAVFTDKIGQTPPSLVILSVKMDGGAIRTVEEQRIAPKSANPPPTVAIFWHSAEEIGTAHADGWIRIWRGGAPTQSVQGPRGLVHVSKEAGFLIASSLEGSAHLYSADTLEPVRAITPEPPRPIRAAALSPGFAEDDLSWLVVAGGRDPRDVTTTGHKEGEFECALLSPLGKQWHSYKSHFSPVHTLATMPNGGFVSGGEDGCVNLFWTNK